MITAPIEISKMKILKNSNELFLGHVKHKLWVGEAFLIKFNPKKLKLACWEILYSSFNVDSRNGGRFSNKKHERSQLLFSPLPEFTLVLRQLSWETHKKGSFYLLQTTVYLQLWFGAKLPSSPHRHFDKISKNLPSFKIHPLTHQRIFL